MSNRLLKYDMSKTDHLISSLKPVSLPLFSNFVNTNTIHPLTQVPNLRVILNSCFSYTPVNLWTSPIISCHHDRALICPLLINSAIIIPGPATEISDLNNWNRLEGVTQSETHRQEPLISSPQQHKNLELKQKSATSLSINCRSANNFFIPRFSWWKKGCIDYYSGVSYLFAD